MSGDDRRSLFEIKRDAERARMELADTVDQLKHSVAGARRRLDPVAIKAEVSDMARTKGEQLLESARENPVQAAAIGALAAWPLFKIARSIPLPIALIGAGLYLTGTRSGKAISQSAIDKAGDLADAAAEAMQEFRDRASDMSSDAADTLKDMSRRATAATGDAIETGRAAGADALATARKLAGDRAADVQDAVRAGTASASKLLDAGREKLDQISSVPPEELAQRAKQAADPLVQWARENPLVVGAFGALIGGFVASAFPVTVAEGRLAGVVSAGVRTGARAAVAQGLVNAAGAAVRAAASGLQPAASDQRCDRDKGAAGATTSL